MTTERLFVYGSLKRGGLHHAELAGAHFLGEAKTSPGYVLVPQGPYLALVPKPGAGAVVGELYELPLERFTALDEFEGEEYERVWLEIEAPLGAEPETEAPSGAEKSKALAYLKRAR